VISDTDDGVSIISDSDDGVEDLEAEVPVVDTSTTFLSDGDLTSGGSTFSSCQTDLSDLSHQELPLELGKKGEPQYIHMPNKEINFYLNALLVVALASVAGLAVGHFLGKIFLLWILFKMCVGLICCYKLSGLRKIKIFVDVLGIQEECYVPRVPEVTEAPVSAETWKRLNSLNHENDLLKMQLKQLQSSELFIQYIILY